MSAHQTLFVKIPAFPLKWHTYFDGYMYASSVVGAECCCEKYELKIDYWEVCRYSGRCVPIG